MEVGLQLLKMSNKNAINELSRLLKKERKEDTNLDGAHMTEIVSIKWFASQNPFHSAGCPQHLNSWQQALSKK